VGAEEGDFVTAGAFEDEFGDDCEERSIYFEGPEHSDFDCEPGMGPGAGHFEGDQGAFRDGDIAPDVWAVCES
jgi:hypothetical protein